MNLTRIYIYLFAFLLLPTTALPLLASHGNRPKNRCSISLTSRLKSKLFHYMQLYVTARGLEEYERISKKTLLKALDELPLNAHWIDLGAGEAKAQSEYAKRRHTFRLPPLRYTAVVMHRPIRTKIKNILGYESPVDFSTGKAFEEYEQGELAPADVITDFVGAFHYSPQADVVLNRALQTLKKGGVFITNVSLATEIRNTEGKVISPHEWAAQGKGLIVEQSDWYILKIRKLADTAKVPSLTLTNISEPSAVAPPMREYQIEKQHER